MLNQPLSLSADQVCIYFKNKCNQFYWKWNIKLTTTLGGVCVLNLSENNLQLTVHLKTREPSIVLRQFAFPTLECFDFHTEKTGTSTQHVFEKKIEYFVLKQRFFCASRFYPIMRLRNNSQQMVRVFYVPHM